MSLYAVKNDCGEWLSMNVEITRVKKYNATWNHVISNRNR